MRRADCLLLAGMLGAGMLGGCMVGPDYKRPPTAVTLSYKELAGWNPAQPADLDPRGDWWSIYHDKVLDGLEQRVAVSNQTLKESEAAYYEAVAVIAEARSALFPTLGATTSLTRNSNSRAGGSSIGNTTLVSPGVTSSSSSGFSGASTDLLSSNVEATLDWDLDLWGRIRRQVEGDVAAAQASAADVANAKLSLQATLATDYFEMRSADSLKQLLDRTVDADRRALQVTQNQYNAGVAARSDVITAETTLQGVVSSDINAGVQRQQLEHAIAVLIGVPPAELTIPPAPLTTNVPVVPVGVPSDLLQRRPDIAAAERTMKEQNALIGVAIAAYYPDVTLSALYGAVGAPAQGLFKAANRIWSLGANASQTLYQGGERRAAVVAQQAAYDNSVATYRQTVLSAFQQVEDELVALHLLTQQNAVQSDAVRLAEQAVTIALNEYRAGTQAYTTVVTAQNTALTDEQTLLTVEQNLMVASVTLVEAIGGGWGDAQLPNADSLQPASSASPF
jgi:NodT family efflux transporter outer membrane factor (OMF) lipoprotein